MGKTTSSRLLTLYATTVLTGVGWCFVPASLSAGEYGYRPPETGYREAESRYEKRGGTTLRSRPTGVPQRAQKPVRILVPQAAAPVTRSAPIENRNTLSAPVAPQTAKPEIYEAPETPKHVLKIDPSLLAPSAPATAPAALLPPATLSVPVASQPIATMRVPEVYEAPANTKIDRIPNALLNPYDAEKAAIVDSPVEPGPENVQNVPPLSLPATPVAVSAGPEVKPIEDDVVVDSDVSDGVDTAISSDTTIPETEPVVVFDAPEAMERLKIDPPLLEKNPLYEKKVEAALADATTAQSINPEDRVFTPLQDPNIAASGVPTTTKAVPTHAAPIADDENMIHEVPVATTTTKIITGNEEKLISVEGDVTESPSKLSEESKMILDSLPTGIGKKIELPIPPPVTMDRASAVNDLFGDDTAGADGKRVSSMGIEIHMKEPDANANQLLEMAYNYLMAGMTLDAINTYQKVLSIEPNNKLALFGLATTYHKGRQLDLARPLYGQLLRLDPYDVEVLNNFLALVSEESPAEAIQSLEALQVENPEFSPLPAQLAVLYQKTGDLPKAIEKMREAARLSPENLAYRYNLAILLDKHGNFAEAASLYRQLLAAKEQGEKIPGSPQQIQERLTFLVSNSRSIN